MPDPRQKATVSERQLQSHLDDSRLNHHARGAPETGIAQLDVDIAEQVAIEKILNIHPVFHKHGFANACLLAGGEILDHDSWIAHGIVEVQGVAERKGRSE